MAKMTDPLIATDLAVNWHPFMQMKDFETYPPKRITSAKGIKLFTDESWYYDTISSWWCNILGHCHPRISDALAVQLNTLDHIMFGNFTHDGAIRLSQRLIDLTPSGLDRVYYSDNGSTAIEVALKMTLNYWLNEKQTKKTKFVCFHGSYHGDTVGAMSISGVSQFSHAFKSLMFDAIALPDPSMNEGAALEALNHCLESESDHIAAVVVEPLLMGAGGMKLTTPAFFKQVRTLTQNFNVHLISDEVATGFGRTGHLFASDAAGVCPDFLCLSKALTNGQLPLAVTLTSNKIYQSFYDDFEKGKTFYHGHTFTANPLGCAVANATLDILNEFNWKQNVQELHALLLTGLSQLSESFSFVSSPRAIGSVGAIDLTLTGDRALFKLSQLGFDHHLTLRPLGSTIYLYLPIITTPDEIMDILSRLKECLTMAGNGLDY